MSSNSSPLLVPVSDPPAFYDLGSITAAVKAAKSVAGFSLLIHVECQSLAEAREAINAGADIIMLDNFTPEALASAANSLRGDWLQSGGGVGRRCLVEVSGGLTEENMEESLCPGTFCIILSLKIIAK